VGRNPIGAEGMVGGLGLFVIAPLGLRPKT